MSDLARYAPQALDLVLQELLAHERQIIDDVCRKIDTDGKLDADYAVQRWITLAENRKLKTRLERRARSFAAEVRRTGAAFDKMQDPE